jgi:adenine-specific DNA-methyltransferase
MAGRLTLSWANKDRALLSHGEDGSEWVDRDDPRNIRAAHNWAGLVS